MQVQVIDVDVPLSAAYEVWTDFETFPAFLPGVESVSQLDATHAHWVVRIGGVARELETEVVEQHPHERVAWRSADGVTMRVLVTCRRLRDTRTRVSVCTIFRPDGASSPSVRLIDDLRPYQAFVLHRRARDLQRVATADEEAAPF